MSDIRHRTSAETPFIPCMVIVDKLENVSTCLQSDKKHPVEKRVNYDQLLRIAATAGNKGYTANKGGFQVSTSSILSALSLAIRRSLLNRDATPIHLLTALV